MSHLIFADDNLLFCKASWEECSTLKETLNIYKWASGQAINYSKLGVCFSANILQEEREENKQILGVSANLNTSKYLGLPSLIGRSKAIIFLCIHERLWTRFRGQQNKNIVQNGERSVNQICSPSNLSVVYEYFYFPYSLLDELYKMLNFFWWGHDSDPKKWVKWESWESLCKHKNEGSLGFHNMHTFNIAILRNFGWRIQKHSETLLSRIL